MYDFFQLACTIACTYFSDTNHTEIQISGYCSTQWMIQLIQISLIYSVYLGHFQGDWVTAYLLKHPGVTVVQWICYSTTNRQSGTQNI